MINRSNLEKEEPPMKKYRKFTYHPWVHNKFQNIFEKFNIKLAPKNNYSKQLEEQLSELRSRVGSLQQELDNSEAVQKDFVRLSQSLQVQLERIREADTQVRWQHEDDVEECQGCKTGFSFTRSKLHCQHCVLY
ncbi:hypothetical protein L9F63_025860, partial [Diploptera punctata]